MNVEIFALCKNATVSGESISVLETFEALRAPVLPMMSPPFFVAARIRFTRIGLADHKIVVRFVDEDGNEIIKPYEQLTPVKMKPGQSTAVAHTVIQLPGVPFHKLGEYAVNLEVDGQEIMSLPLLVKR